MSKQRRIRGQQVVLTAIAAMGFASIAEATTYTWVTAGAGVNWSTAANWKDQNGNAVAPPVDPAAGDTTDLVFTNPTPSLSQTSSQAAGTIAVNSMTFVGPYTGAASIQISGSTTLDTFLYLGAGGITGNIPGDATNPGSLSFTANNFRRLILTADQTWTNNNLFGIISQRRIMESTFKITKAGLGTIEFQMDGGSWSGGLQIDEGVVRLSTATNAIGVGPLIVNTANNVSISCSGSVNQIVAGPVSLAGTGSLAFVGSNNIQFDNVVTLLTDKSISTGRVGTFNNSITGSFGITKLGTGTLVFNGSNSYQGNTTIANGILDVNDFSQLGTSTNPIGLGGSTVAGVLSLRAAGQSTNRGLNVGAGGGSLAFTGGLTINGPITSTSGSLTRSGTGVLTTGSIRIGGTLIATTGDVVTKPDGSDAASNRLGSLTLGGALGAWTTKLNLNNNHLVIDYTGASPLATVADQIKSGYASGAWTGQGITSGSAATIAASIDPHKTALGYIEASTTGITSFAGQTVDADSIVVRYTLAGDANADGKVNALDFNAVASNFGSGTGLWFSGDFNYDGTVNGLDFSAVATNFNMSFPGPGPALGALVPEPASLASMIVVAGLAARRRQK